MHQMFCQHREHTYVTTKELTEGSWYFGDWTLTTRASLFYALLNIETWNIINRETEEISYSNLKYSRYICTINQNTLRKALKDFNKNCKANKFMITDIYLLFCGLNIIFVKHKRKTETWSIFKASVMERFIQSISVLE